MSTVHHPRFARIWSWAMRHEPKDIVRARTELLSGLTGRVLEVGAGTGSNFEHYPAEVTEVVAVEPEATLRLEAAAHAATLTGGPTIRVVDGTFEELPAAAAGPFDAVVCSLVLCTVPDPAGAVRIAFDRLRPGGELRYYEHVATDGALGALQRAVDATFWPRAFGGCHAHRPTVATIDAAGFERVRHRDVRVAPRFTPVPISPVAMGVARRPVVD